MATKLFLGFDPGGAGGTDRCKKRNQHDRPCQGHFGWSICCEDDSDRLERLETGLAQHARDVLNQVQGTIEARYSEGNFLVVAAGIDAPLQWNRIGDRQGYRRADDDLIRVLNATQGHPKRVVAPYRLAGEVGLQGPLVAGLLGGRWDLMITESHPTVFLHLLAHSNQPQMVEMATRLTANLPDRERCEIGHERDATLGAIPAWAATQAPPLPNWQNLYDQDPNLFNPSGVPVSYWMPIPH